jgi:hypothetical protein
VKEFLVLKLDVLSLRLEASFGAWKSAMEEKMYVIANRR